MLKLEPCDFQSEIDNLVNRKITFFIDGKRDKSDLFVDGKFCAQSRKKKLTWQWCDGRDFVSLCSVVKKSINKFIINSGLKLKKIKQRHLTTNHNRIKYERMEVGAEFFYIDINHCFWRSAFILGYISEKLYKSALENKNLKKTQINMSLSCSIAPKWRKYYINGIYTYTISEDNSLWQICYDNVRFTAYNLMGDTMMAFSKYALGYKTDGIMVTKPAVNGVCEMIKAAGFDYKVVRCRKNDDETFTYYEGNKSKSKRF